MFALQSCGIGLVFTCTLLCSCSSDEESIRPPSPQTSIINTEFENARVIDVDSHRHWALLLHTSESTSGTAIELVNLTNRSVIRHRILDYYEVYDVKFVSDNEACFAGRPFGSLGYAVRFFSLPDLVLETQIITAGLSGEPGSLAVDSTGSYVYYSHAGGGDDDGIYRIRVSDKTLVDADNDGVAPYAFDNDLVSGLFSHPSRVCVDNISGKLVIANAAAVYVTLLDLNQWGTLDRSANLTFPIPGTSHLQTTFSESPVNMAYGAGVYVLAGENQSLSFLARFGVNSNGLDLYQSVPGVQWRSTGSSLFVHPRDDVVSLFVLEEDTSGIAVAQYRLNNLSEVANSPFRTRTIPDTSVISFGVDIVSDQLIVADKDRSRLELIHIE
jgi:hypothetical protein